MDIKELETLTVGIDEVLVLRVADDDPAESAIQDLHDHLEAGPLRGRYVLFVGEIEFAAKVKS